MRCPECRKWYLQVTKSSSALELAYDHSNLITIVEATCAGCKAVFESRNVHTAGWQRVKLGTTTRTNNSSTSLSVRDAEGSGLDKPSPTDPNQSWLKCGVHREPLPCSQCAWEREHDELI